MGEGGIESSDARYIEVAGFYENGNEPLDFIKCAEFLR
jgi:hypothetical protein